MSRRKGDAPPDVSLPITPMLDMTFQLMFFFITTFNPDRMVEGYEEMTLPPKIVAAGPKVDVKVGAEPILKPLELKQELFVRLKSNQGTRGVDVYLREGELLAEVGVGTMFTYGLEKDKEDRTTSDTKAALVAKLKPLLESKVKAVKDLKLSAEDTEKELDKISVTVESDRKVPWGFVVATQDVCQQAGCRRGRVLLPKPTDLDIGAEP